MQNEGDQKRDVDPDATSDDTLRDVEETKEISESSSDADSHDVPSPDGDVEVSKESRIPNAEPPPL